jgi:hypothetical protein
MAGSNGPVTPERGAKHLAQRFHEELRPAAEGFERGLQRGRIYRAQFRPLFLDQFGDEGDEIRPQEGHALNLRAVERGGGGFDQTQQLVAVRTGHYQHRVHFVRAVHLVPRGLQRRHGVFSRLAGQRVLRFVDDHRDRLAKAASWSARRASTSVSPSSLPILRVST